MNNLKKIILITGGIGSGKSVVSQTIRTLGYAVYDCDKRAKWIMDEDAAIKCQIAEAFGDNALTNGRINKPFLAQTIFGNDAARKTINGIVHPAVHTDFLKWAAGQGSNIVFIESAIPREGDLLQFITEAWQVEAPEDVRVQRVMARNGFSREQVLARVQAQLGEHLSGNNVVTITNDNITPIIPQIINRLSILNNNN